MKREGAYRYATALISQAAVRASEHPTPDVSSRATLYLKPAEHTMPMVASEPSSNAIQRVRKTQRQHARAAWADVFGDEPLPQLGSSAEWTEWVVQERQSAAAEMERWVSMPEVRAAMHFNISYSHIPGPLSHPPRLSISNFFRRVPSA